MSHIGVHVGQCGIQVRMIQASGVHGSPRGQALTVEILCRLAVLSGVLSMIC
jgi:hypothetical protein